MTPVSTLPLVISQAALQLVERFTAKGYTLALAESCTGGMVAAAVTDVAGSSAVLTHGWVTYANAAKVDCLAVPEALLQQYGAVSEPVAKAMAKGALQQAGSTVALAITGIAGPGGGSPDKPVGMVCIALAHRDGTTSHTHYFSGARLSIRLASVQTALTLLLTQA